MLRTQGGSARWTLPLLFCLIPFIGYGEAATVNEVNTVASNWLRLIVERDANWGGARNPSIGKVMEFRRGDLLLGYYVSARPQGYMIVSSFKDFSPIKAYSTTSNLDPDDDIGICALLKDVLERRLRLLIDGSGGLDAARLRGLRKRTPDANRSAWSYLLGAGSTLQTNLQSLYQKSSGPAGPLLETSWHQGFPYNKFAPIGYGGSHSVAGCTAIATAQIMRYYRWPPHGKGNHTDGWDGDDSCPGGETDGWDLDADFSDSYDWVNMPDSSTTTTVQEDAVAELCYEVAVAVDMDFGCCGSGAPICASLRKDARGALEDYFYYNTQGNEPACEDRNDYTRDQWWNIIRNEIDHNRPMLYHIEGPADFIHNLVLDGYDNSGGHYQIHLNYGWNDAQTTWYTLDSLDCDAAEGFQGGCNPDKETLVRYIYPRDGCFGTAYGTFPSGYYSYVYGDITSSKLTAQPGAWVQFLGGAKGTRITCTADSLYFSGSANDHTRFYSRGDLTNGLKLVGGHITLRPKGSITMH